MTAVQAHKFTYLSEASFVHSCLPCILETLTDGKTWPKSRGATTSRVGGPIPWSTVILHFYRKKIDRSTQFGAVGYIVTLYSSKSYVKSWGSVQILVGPDPPNLHWLHPFQTI